MLALGPPAMAKLPPPLPPAMARRFPMSSEERRMDSDQQWYTLHEFQDYYGIDRAARLWEEARREGQCTQFCALWWHPPCWGVGPCRCFRPADHPNTVLCACRHCMRPADDPGTRWKRFVRRYSALVRMRRQHHNSGFVLRRFLAMRLYPDKRELWPEH